MFHFLQKIMFKKNRNKGTSNVLQGEGVSGVLSKTTLLHFLGPFPKGAFIYYPLPLLGNPKWL